MAPSPPGPQADSLLLSIQRGMGFFQIKSEPFNLQMRRPREVYTGARACRGPHSPATSASPGNLRHGVTWPHKVQTSDLSPGTSVCMLGPLQRIGARPAD